MRIVQIIDSLEAGGAERMAVNYANALAGKISFSGLIATRKEGMLLNQINEKVSYLFLKKKSSLDFRAILKIRDFVKENKVDIIHAHGSSFFIAVLVKLTLPKIKIIWHDHYGSRSKESRNQNKVLSIASLFFTSILVVNHQLEIWNNKYMLCKNVIFIPNFSLDTNEYQQITNLKGTNGKRIVFLANLKNPKNHVQILKAFLDLELYKSDWSLHLIGRDYFDAYSEGIKKFVEYNSLEDYIHLYGVKSDIKYILSQASIGVLASTEEGFPVTLLEYASEGLPVVSTNVGYCSHIIQDGFNGVLFDPSNELEIKTKLLIMVKKESFRKLLGANFKESIKSYSEEIVIEKLILIYKKYK